MLRMFSHHGKRAAAPVRKQANRSFFSLIEYARSRSWTPRLLNHGDLDRLLPWGFVEQTQVLDGAIPIPLTRQLSETRGDDDVSDSEKNTGMMIAAASSRPTSELLQSRLGDLQRWVQQKTTESLRVGSHSFQLAGTSHAEFVDGAQRAYQFLADLWSSDQSLDPASIERVATPALAELMRQAHQTSREEHGVQPNLLIQPHHPIHSVVVKCEIEEGRAHKPGQVFGLWDRDEMVASLLEGAAGPEAQLLRQRDSMKRSQMTGSDPHVHIPHRLVAHCLFLVREKYECQYLAAAQGCSNSAKGARGERRGQKQSEEGEKEVAGTNLIGTFPLQCHIWEFETDVGVSLASGQDVKLQWRVRNINSALSPRAGRVLKSEGLV